jgi:predicted nucleotidyltransferase
VATDFEAVKREARQFAAEARAAMPVERVILFGSYAKGTADELSNVDIAFFFRELPRRKWRGTMIRLMGMTHHYDAYFEPKLLLSSEFERGNPFVEEIVSTGIEL